MMPATLASTSMRPFAAATSAATVASLVMSPGTGVTSPGATSGASTLHDDNAKTDVIGPPVRFVTQAARRAAGPAFLDPGAATADT